MNTDVNKESKFTHRKNNIFNTDIRTFPSIQVLSYLIFSADYWIMNRLLLKHFDSQCRPQNTTCSGAYEMEKGP